MEYGKLFSHLDKDDSDEDDSSDLRNAYKALPPPPGKKAFVQGVKSSTDPRPRKQYPMGARMDRYHSSGKESDFRRHLTEHARRKKARGHPKVSCLGYAKKAKREIHFA